MTLAHNGREVFAVDPSRAMLNYARQRPDADKVIWVEGDSTVLPHGLFDLAIMTGNVAQHIPDPVWTQTLVDLRNSLNPGGLLAFESRNPARRAWESWNDEEPGHRDTPFGPLTEWSKSEELGHGRVLLRSFSKFMSTGQRIQEEVILTFRTQQQIQDELHAAGFEVEAIWGDWNLVPFDGSQDIMIFEARAI